MSLIECSSRQLNLLSLVNGQSFRWRNQLRDGVPHFVGVAKHRVWDVWRVDDRKIAFNVLSRFVMDSNEASHGDEKLLRDYFQLDINLEALFNEWTGKDEVFRSGVESSRLTKGIRILKQDALEALLAFICSSNNNIARISGMVNRLCELYGTKINTAAETFYDFPTLAQLNSSLPRIDEQLRESGFGYRAAYIAGTVRQLVEYEASSKQKFRSECCWLETLKSCSYEEAKDRLLTLPGVGPKVADCVCLMGLQKHEAVPIDTHVFQLTTEMYAAKHLPELANKPGRTKGLGRRDYSIIGDFYRHRFGAYAGWAQSVLFTSRIKT